MAYSTITKSSLHFNTKTYTGNGSTQSITGIGYQPDLVWTKGRNDTYSQTWIDAVRGGTKYIYSDSSAAEATNANAITSFTTDGYNVGSFGSLNDNSQAYVSWNWKANGQGSSNTAGSINTTYTSANTTSGVSIIKYTGNGSNATLGHGLGVAPKMLIVKVTSQSNDWMVGHEGLDATNPWHKYIYLNGTSAVDDAATFWNDTAPTNQVIYLGTHSYVNYSGRTYIMYAFADVKGFSKFGSYTGNGNNNGTFIYTGFKPAFVAIKRTDDTARWVVWDNKRSPFNLMDKGLFPNSNVVENNGYWKLDCYSNGFKMRRDEAEQNANNGNFIYMAFAENPLVANVGQSIPATAR